MQRYFVEGLFVSKAGLKKAQKSGRVNPGDVEPFAQAFWAESPAEALQMASEAIAGGQWTEGPRLSDQTEEQRMRQMGAPELPGFGSRTRRSLSTTNIVKRGKRK
jgi:hypothetical protein